MKGIIFNLAEKAVSQEHGPEAWERILERARLDGAYTAVGSYEDSEFHRIADAAAAELGVTKDDVVRFVGQRSLGMLADRYPDFFREHRSIRTFLLTLNDVIHPEVRKLYPGAYAPNFEVEIPDDRTVRLAYLSHRDLCPFAEGLVQGAAGYFGETVHVTQPECTRNGARKCIIECRVEPAASKR